MILWDVDPVTQQLSHRKTFEGHTLGVSCLAWSPDDTLLLVCGYEESSDLWIWNVVVSSYLPENTSRSRFNVENSLRSSMIFINGVLLHRSQTGDLKHKMSHSADDSLTTCAWQSSGDRFITGSYCRRNDVPDNNHSIKL